MPWSTDYLEQRQFINGIAARLSEAERLIVPALTVSTSAPTGAQLLNAWQIRYPNDDQIAENGRIAWLNPVTDTVVNTYRKVGLPQVITPVPTQGWFPIYRKSYEDDSSVIGDTVNFGTTYTHLFFHAIVRLTTAAASGALVLRLANNVNAVGVLDASLATVQNATFTGSAVTNSGLLNLVAPAATSHPSSFLSFQMMMYDYQSVGTKAAWVTQGMTHTAPFTNRIVSTGAVLSRQTTALATGQITNTNLAKGTRLTWWGYKA